MRVAEPERVVPCVGAIVIIEHRLLLVQRANEPEAGRWSLPGGRIEPGEMPEVAARREVAEETGLAVRIGSVCGSVRLRRGGVRYEITDYFATRLSGDPVPGDDALALRLVGGAELAELPLSRGLYRFLGRHGVLDLLGSQADLPIG